MTKILPTKQLKKSGIQSEKESCKEKTTDKQYESKSSIRGQEMIDCLNRAVLKNLNDSASLD